MALGISRLRVSEAWSLEGRVDDVGVASAAAAAARKQATRGTAKTGQQVQEFPLALLVMYYGS